MSRFGNRASIDDRIREFVGSDDYLVTGSSVWNRLGLGVTGVLAVDLVYTTRLSGRFGSFLLRRTPYPNPTPVEWFVIDLFENGSMVGASATMLLEPLKRATSDGLFDPVVLLEMAREYGSPETLRQVTLTCEQVLGACQNNPCDIQRHG